MDFLGYFHYPPLTRVQDRDLDDLDAADMEEGFLVEEHLQDLSSSLSSCTVILVECKSLCVQLSPCPPCPDPPSHLELSSGQSLHLEEGQEVEPVLCSGAARPAPKVSWTREGEQVESREGQLIFPEPVTRSSAPEARE